MTRTVKGIAFDAIKIEGDNIVRTELVVAEKELEKATKKARKMVGNETALVNPRNVVRRYFMPDEIFFKYATMIPLDAETGEDESEE